MQVASILRTSALVPSTRQCCKRQVFQPNVAPVLSRGSRTILSRAEADNTGESITNSGHTKGKDSYEVCISRGVDSDQSCDCLPSSLLDTRVHRFVR